MNTGTEHPDGELIVGFGLRHIDLKECREILPVGSEVQCVVFPSSADEETFFSATTTIARVNTNEIQTRDWELDSRLASRSVMAVDDNGNVLALGQGTGLPGHVYLPRTRVSQTQVRLPEFLTDHRAEGASTTDVDRLEFLSHHPAAGNRAAVATNPATPGHLLDLLESDPSDHVRRDVAGNPSTPMDVLDRIVHADEGRWFEMRMDVIATRIALSNPSISTANVETILGALGALLPSTDQAIASTTHWLARSFIENPCATSSRLLDTFDAVSRETNDPMLDFAFLDNRRTPTDVVDRMAENEEGLVRARAARHPNISNESLERLAEDTDDSVRATAVEALAERAGGTGPGDGSR